MTVRHMWPSTAIAFGLRLTAAWVGDTGSLNLSSSQFQESENQVGKSNLVCRCSPDEPSHHKH